MKETFAERLAEALKKRGWRAVDLSNATEISKSRISQYLKGTYEAKEEALKKIAEALNVNEVWLMGYDVDPSVKEKTIYKTDESIENLQVAESKHEFKTLAAHISDELGLSEEMANTIIDIAKKLKGVDK